MPLKAEWYNVQEWRLLHLSCHLHLVSNLRQEMPLFSLTIGKTKMQKQLERLKKRYRCLLVNPAKLLKGNLPLWKEGLCNKVLPLFTQSDFLEVVRQAGGSQILRGKAVTLVTSPGLSEWFRLSYFSFCDTRAFFFKVSLVVVIKVLTHCNVASVLNNWWTSRLISKSQFYFNFMRQYIHGANKSFEVMVSH